MKKGMALCLVISILLMSIKMNAFAGDTRNDFYIQYDGQVYKYTNRTVTISIDGKQLSTGEMPAIILNNSTLVPAREVFESEAIKAKVDWKDMGTSQQISISYGTNSIILQIGSTTALVNGEIKELEVAPRLIRDMSQSSPKTMIPIRFITENLGFKVDWDPATYTAAITSPVVTSEESVEDQDDTLNGVNSDKPERALPTALASKPVTFLPLVVPDVSSVTPSPLTELANPETTIDSASFDAALRQFAVQAAGPITKVETHFWDGKFVVDIHNAVTKLSSQVNYSDNPYAYRMRSSQQSVNALGQKVARVVLELKNPDFTFNVSLSQDRKTLYISGDKNYMNEIHLAQNEKGDYLDLMGTIAPVVNAFRLSNPDRIVFDVKEMESLLKYQEAIGVEGQYINAIRTSQFDANTTRIVVETLGQPDYVIEKLDGKSTRIQFVQPAYDNISYINEGTPIIKLENAASLIKLSDITYEDLYNSRQYIIHLPGNYKSLFGEGSLDVMDDIIESISIVDNANGNTDLIIKEKTIHEFRMEADDKHLYIKAYKPKALYSKILVLDFGHGGTDPGAISSDGSVYEKTLNLAIGNNVRKMLDANTSIKVYYSRPIDQFVTLQERTNIANEVEADFFISIHNNSFTPQHNGTETIYFKSPLKPGLDSVELAEVLQKHLVADVGLYNRGVKDNNALFVLKNTNMPAAIAEVSFVSNSADLAKIIQVDYQQKAAKAIYDAIVEVFDTYPTGR